MNLIKPVAWSDIALGVWLLAAPSVVGYQITRPIVVVEDLAPGLFLCATSAAILILKAPALRVEWLQAICGLWLLAGSVALVFSRLPQAALNGVVVGVAVIALSLSAWLTIDLRSGTPS